MSTVTVSRIPPDLIISSIRAVSNTGATIPFHTVIAMVFTLSYSIKNHATRLDNRHRPDLWKSSPGVVTDVLQYCNICAIIYCSKACVLFLTFFLKHDFGQTVYWYIVTGGAKDKGVMDYIFQLAHITGVIVSPHERSHSFIGESGDFSIVANVETMEKMLD